MGLENIIYPRPTDEFIFVNREPVDATCPKCGSKNVRKYPVASYMGPKIATKCQDCLHRIAMAEPQIEDRWPPFRPLAYDWQRSEAG